MRHFTLFFVLFFAAVLSFAQGDQSRQARIDSLESLRRGLAYRLKMVEAELADLKTVKVETPITTAPSEYIKIKIKNPFDLINNELGQKVRLSVGDSIELLSLEGYDFQVRYKGQQYSAFKYNVYNNWMDSTDISTQNIQAEWEQWDRPRRIQRERERQRIEKQQQLIKRQQAEDQRKLEARQAAMQKKLALEKAAERKQSLIDRYGSSITERILNHKIWLGMTRAMAIESRGYPEKNNRTVTAFGTHEQWVYENIYLYFENDILTSWQD